MFKPDENSQSLCDTCIAPGNCCRALTVHLLVPMDMGRDELREHLRDGIDPWTKEQMDEPFPFEPLRPTRFFANEGELKPHSCYWAYSCPKLDDATGRCTIYDRRPFPCREYKAGQDPLCVHFEGDWDPYITNYDNRDADKEIE